MPIKLNVNGQCRTVDVDPETPLLWVLRDTLGLTGTKFGCGFAECGACTVHVEGETRRSCVTSVRVVSGRSVTTIEGLGDGDSLHPLQQAWLDDDVVQCGYCQTGQLISAAALLRANPSPSDEEINLVRIGNICRFAGGLGLRAGCRAGAGAGDSGFFREADPRLDR